MKIKKKVLAALTALSLAATCIAPIAALADYDVTDEYPTTITLPNGEVREIPTVEVADTAMTADADVAAVSTSTYTLESIDDFNDIGGTSSVWYSGKTFIVTGDLDFSDVSISEWGGAIKYFYGTIIGQKKEDGTYPKITGIPENCAFIYGIMGGSISNLIFEHEVTDTDGGASFITLMPVNTGSTVYSVTLDNIEVTGNISLTGSDQSNYSPFVYCTSLGGITMTNCTNSATINGSVYGSVFYGYYPIYDVTYKFDNCVNDADVTLLYAGMFFGNPINIEKRMANNEFTLIITNCKNNKCIRGTSGAKYYAAPVNSSDYAEDSNMWTVEQILEGNADSTDSIEQIDVSGGGTLCTGDALVDFSATVDSYQNINVTRPTNETTANISYYVVTVGAYVHLYGKDGDTGEYVFSGTDRVSVTQTISVNDIDKYLLDEDNTTVFTPELMAFGFADSNYGYNEDSYYCCGYKVLSGDDGDFYEVDNSLTSEGLFCRYVSTALGDDGNPAGNGTEEASIIVISAYTSDGTLVGTCSAL